MRSLLMEDSWKSKAFGGQEERPRALHKKYSVSIFYYAPEPNKALSRRTYCSLRERTYRLAPSRVMHRCSLSLCSVDETFTLIVVLVVPKSVGIHWFASKPDYAWHSRQRSALGVISTVSFNSQRQLLGHLLCSSPPYSLPDVTLSCCTFRARTPYLSGGANRTGESLRRISVLTSLASLLFQSGVYARAGAVPLYVKRIVYGQNRFQSCYSHYPYIEVSMVYGFDAFARGLLIDVAILLLDLP